MKITTAQLKQISNRSIREEILKAQSGKSLNEDGIRAAGGRITRTQLRQIIREEIEKMRKSPVSEAFNPDAAKKVYDKLDALASRFGFKSAGKFDGGAAPGNNIGRWDDTVWGKSSYANLYRDERGNLFVGFSNIGDKSRKGTYSGKDRADKWLTASKWNEEFGTLAQRKASK